jgi:2-hydroxychromene-2-carboxylate isomerase
LDAPVFYYDLSSPYSYLAALRVDDVLPTKPAWRPIVFGSIVQRTGKVPWSFGPGRDDNIAEIVRRAAERGLPELTWPPGWPLPNYSVNRLRAALVAEEQGKIEDYSRAAYHLAFAECRPLVDEEDFMEAARRSGVDPEAVREGIARQEIKDRLRSYTEEAFDRGVRGVPTVAVGDQLFWGDDRLEDAAAALSG